MVLFLGMAALAVDYGLGVNERRADQTAVDAGATGGAVESLNGGPAVRDQALNYVRLNLPTTYSNAEWQALWESCVDPAAERNAGGGNFVALPAPAGWAVTDPSNWCISAEAARGLLRVRVPHQVINTAFAPIIGVDQLSTQAVAVSRIRPVGNGGILPFGIPLGAGNGGHICMSSAPSGLAIDPCTGSTSGNFGTLKARKFGNSEYSPPTTANCNASPLGAVLAQNIAHGVDHVVVPDKDGVAANEVRDTCYQPYVDTLNTDTGFPNNGAEEGLVGPVPGGWTPRLAQYGSNDMSVFGRTVDNTPLWYYLRPISSGATYTGPGSDGPASCHPNLFVAGAVDWTGDGVDDGEGLSWQHMQACIDDYVAGAGSYGVIFKSSLGDNYARFGYVPEFWESTLGSGNSWLHIKRFRAIYIQSTLWKKGGDYVLHHPGQGCVEDDGSGAEVALSPCTGGGYSMKQVTSFVIPDAALPEALRGDPPPGGIGVNPFIVELYD